MSRLEKLCKGGVFLAAGDDYRKSRRVLLGVPLDHTTSFRAGTREGPGAIRAASYCLEEYSIISGKDLRDVCFFDAGDLPLPPGGTEESLRMIEEAVTEILQDEKIPLLLGGEHLLTLGALRAVSRFYDGLAVVQLDAHADLRPEYLGVAHTHASVMYHIKRELAPEIFQFGIRSATAEEVAFARENTHFYPFQVLPPLQEALPLLKGRPVYLSLDIDVADPAYAPGTGAPEPGGITSSELLEAAVLLGGLQLVGMDIVEVYPPYDPSGITAMLAAKVIRELILAPAGL